MWACVCFTPGLLFLHCFKDLEFFPRIFQKPPKPFSEGGDKSDFAAMVEAAKERGLGRVGQQFLAAAKGPERSRGWLGGRAG